MASDQAIDIFVPCRVDGSGGGRSGRRIRSPSLDLWNSSHPPGLCFNHLARRPAGSSSSSDTRDHRGVSSWRLPTLANVAIAPDVFREGVVARKSQDWLSGYVGTPSAKKQSSSTNVKDKSAGWIPARLRGLVRTGRRPAFGDACCSSPPGVQICVPFRANTECESQPQ